METDADWQDSKTARECLAHLCLTERMSDVIFGFLNSPVKLHAHKFVLSMRSAVFEAMFYGPMAVKTQEIMIEDSNPETFKLFLRYVYSDTTDLDDSTLLDCFYLGRKYCVEGLAQACFTFLETSVSPENICTIYEQASKLDFPLLHTKCLRLMAIHAEPIFQSEKFLDISNKTLIAFLSCDDLIAEEISIFNACDKWAKHQCLTCEEDKSTENVREHIGDALYSIRFPIMPLKTLAEEIGPCQLLTSDEEIQVYRFMATNTDLDLDLESKVVGRFKAYKRKPRIAVVELGRKDGEKVSCWSPDYDIIEFCIYLSSKLKLLTVSDNTFCNGVKTVIVNSTELREDEWVSKDNELVFVRGTTLIDGNNTLVVMTEVPHSDYDFPPKKKHRRKGKIFDVLGTKIEIEYDWSTGRRMTFGK